MKRTVKTIYTIKFQLDESETPQISTSWPKYDDKKIQDRFNDIQLYVVAHNYLNDKDKNHAVLKDIFIKFCEEITERQLSSPQ